MKYDIVKDLTQETQLAEWKSAKQERKGMNR